MTGGTLENLANAIVRNHTDTDLSIRTLDLRFRPKFDDMLVSLRLLHIIGLCHDDFKLEDIFAAQPSTEHDGMWLLGNLGNVREVSHPYHASEIWTHSNKQLPDCRANGALRATKTYLQFLRHAVSS